MGAFVDAYVRGCDICQRYKTARHPSATLQPQDVPSQPWEIIGVDLITQLPTSNGFDSICVYVDHLTDLTHLVPCTTKLTAEGAAELHYRDIFRLHDMPKKVISDRGPQFAAQFMRALYKRLGITAGLTTAFHPRGNGKVERKNQRVENYLRIFCNDQQDDWADLLPAAEFALNTTKNESTGRSAFELAQGYQPDFHAPIGHRSNIPSLEERLDRMEKARQDAQAALRLAKERMKAAWERGKNKAHSFNIGDKVWLSAKEVKLKQPSPKLGPRQLGPFEVTERIGDLDYRLKLPRTLRLHDVFHVDRLAPYHDNGIKAPPPPPVIVDGEERHELDSIIDSEYYGRGLRYLVKWTGYAIEQATWEPASKMRKQAPEAVEEFHALYPDKPAKINSALLN